MQVMRTPQGTPVQTENMANVQHAVQDILDRGDALAGDRLPYSPFYPSSSSWNINPKRYIHGMLEHASVASRISHVSKPPSLISVVALSETKDIRMSEIIITFQ